VTAARAYLRSGARVSVAVLALGVLLLLWYRAQAFDPSVYGRVQSTLGQIETTWAELAEDVLRIRHGLGRNYDSLVYNLTRLGALTASLGSADGGGEELHSVEVERDLHNLKMAIAEKTQLIERFKTRNAMLRNALLYFPESIDRVSADPDLDPELREFLRSLRVAVLDIHLGHPAISMERVSQRLEELAGLSDFYPDRLSAELRRIATHGRLILTLEQELEAQLPVIVDRSRRIFVGALAEAYADEYRHRVLWKNLYHVALFATALGLLVFGAWTHLRLRYRSRELRAALNRVENQQHALDEHAIVSTIDVKGTVIYANQKFCDISGYDREQLLGRDYRAVNWGGHPQALLRDILRTVRKGHCWHGEVMNRARDGHGYWVAATVVPFLDDAGKPYQYILIQTDISARKQVEKRLHQALEQAQAANRAKSRFLANMSHEIRTPIHGVLGMLQLLADTQLTEKQREFTNIARTSAQSLLTLIGDILDFSKIEADSLDIDAVAFGLRELVSETLQGLAFQAEEKGLQLDSKVTDEVPDRLVGDPARLRQILFNLLGNGIKFTERGQVGVKVTLEETLRDSPEAGDRMVLRFCVVDTGIGIPAETREKIFEAFSQADTSISRRYGGTGLGLSISARLVELMGGRIWLESEPGQGSRFFFTVSVSMDAAGQEHSAEPETAEALPAAAETIAPVRDAEVLRVLVVEDYPINRTLISAILESRHCEISMAKHGAEALELFAPGRFDLVLMDLRMPQMDGFEATTLIREREREAGVHTHIVAMTAHAMKGYRERCLSAGMDDYIAKPFDSQELLDVVDSVQAGLGSQISPGSVSVSRIPAARKRGCGDGEVDRAYALSLVGRDEGLLAVVNNAFIDDYSRQITLMEAAVAGRDQRQAQLVAHYLKGLLGSVGALDAQARARELEALAKREDWAGFTGRLSAFKKILDTVAQSLRPEEELVGTQAEPQQKARPEQV